MNIMGYQFVKGAFLLFLSYVLFFDLSGTHFLTETGNILLANCTIGEEKFGFSCVILILTVTSLFGFTFFIRNLVVEKNINSLISFKRPVTKRRKLIGKKGKVKSIDGVRFISVDGKLYNYISADKKERALGRQYIVIGEKGDKVVI